MKAAERLRDLLQTPPSKSDKPAHLPHIDLSDLIHIEEPKVPQPSKRRAVPRRGPRKPTKYRANRRGRGRQYMRIR